MIKKNCAILLNFFNIIIKIYNINSIESRICVNMDINIPSREDFDYFYVKPPSFWLAWSLIYILGILFFVSSFFPELHNNND